jgi:hypothetical protein
MVTTYNVERFTNMFFFFFFFFVAIVTKTLSLTQINWTLTHTIYLISSHSNVGSIYWAPRKRRAPHPPQPAYAHDTQQSPNFQEPLKSLLRAYFITFPFILQKTTNKLKIITSSFKCKRKFSIIVPNKRRRKFSSIIFIFDILSLNTPFLSYYYQIIQQKIWVLLY